MICCLLWLAVGGLVATTLVLHLATCVRATEEDSLPVRVGKALLGLVVMGGTLGLVVGRYSHPSENLLGNHDQGMYVAAAVQTARTGSPSLSTSDLEELNRDKRKLWLQQQPAQTGRQNGLPPLYWGLPTGYFLADQQTLEGPAWPHFPPGFPTWLATLADTGGPVLLLGSNLLLTIIAACWLALLACEWFGVGAGLAAFPLFLLNPLVLWSANRHYAEPLLLVLWLGIVWHLTRRATAPVLTGIAVALGLAAACLTKIDALALLPLLGGFAVLGRTGPSWRYSLFAAALVAGSLAAWVLWARGAPYFGDTLRAISSDRTPLFVIGGVFLLVAMAVGFPPVRKWLSANPSPWLFGLVVVGVFVTLMAFRFVRARGGATDEFFYFPLGGAIPSYRELTLQRLDWYWPVFGVWPLLAVLGYIALHVRESTIRVFLLAGAASLLFLAYDVRCNPRQPYCMRRFIPYVLPMLALGGGAAVTLAARRSHALGAGAVLLGLVYVHGYAGVNEALHRLPEHGGMWQHLEHVAAFIPPETTVVIADRSPLQPLALPLRCIFGRKTWVIRFDKRDPELQSELHDSLVTVAAHGRGVWLLDGSEVFALNLPHPARNRAVLFWRTAWQPGSYLTLDPGVKTVEWRCALNELPGVAEPPRDHPGTLTSSSTAPLAHP